MKKINALLEEQEIADRYHLLEIYRYFKAVSESSGYLPILHPIVAADYSKTAFRVYNSMSRQKIELPAPEQDPVINGIALRAQQKGMDLKELVLEILEGYEPPDDTQEQIVVLQDCL